MRLHGQGLSLSRLYIDAGKPRGLHCTAGDHQQTKQKVNSSACMQNACATDDTGTVAARARASILSFGLA